MFHIGPMDMTLNTILVGYIGVTFVQKVGYQFYLPRLHLSGGHGVFLPLQHEMAAPIMKLFCLKLSAELMAALDVYFFSARKRRAKGAEMETPQASMGLSMGRYFLPSRLGVCSGGALRPQGQTPAEIEFDAF